MIASDLIAELAAKLRATGLHTATDPRDAVPPCAVIFPRVIRPRTSCLARVELQVQLIAPGVGHGDALVWLDSTLGAAWQAIGRWEATVVAFDSPQTGVPLLAYEMTYIADIQ